MDPSQYQEALHSYIDSATSLSDLCTMLEMMHFDRIREFVRGEVIKMSYERTRSMHLNALPIDSVLPDKAMQNILSFGDYTEQIANRLVSKKWKGLYRLNEEEALQRMCESIQVRRNGMVQDVVQNEQDIPSEGTVLNAKRSQRREQYLNQSVESVKGTNTKRGNLMIKVHGALQLKHDGNLVDVTVAGNCLRTKKV